MSKYFILIPILWSSLILPLVVSHDVIAQEASDPNIKNLRQQIKDKQLSLKRSKKKQKAIYKELKKSETAISRANFKLSKITKKREKLLKEIKEIVTESERLRKEIAKSRKNLSLQLYHLYVNQNAGASGLQVLLSPKGFNETVVELKYLSYLAKHRGDQLITLKRDLEKLEELRNKQKIKEKKLKKSKQKEDENRIQLLAQKENKRRFLKKVKGDIKRTTKEIKKNELALNRKIEEIRRKAERDKKKQEVMNTQIPGPENNVKAFSLLKGKLRLPVIGRLKHQFGSKREGDILWKGIFITCNSGDPVRAIASGEVVFADWLGGFGNLMIIDHGGGYLSLYGNNESLLKEVGKVVKAGEKVGTVGNTGGNLVSGLYFELRFKGKPFNPMKWVKL